VQALYGSISYGAGSMLGNIASGAVWEWLGAGPTFSLGAIFAAISLLMAWRCWRREPLAGEPAVR
jgi:PPP family 3-phenylpropionic acid transporter